MRIPANCILGALLVFCSLSCASPKNPDRSAQSVETARAQSGIVFEQQISSSLAEDGWSLLNVENVVVEVLKGKHVLTVHTTAPGAGWKIHLQKKETGGRRIREFVLIGKPPAENSGGKPTAVATGLETEFDKNVMLVVVSGKNGDQTEPVPEIPGDISNTSK